MTAPSVLTLFCTLLVTLSFQVVYGGEFYGLCYTPFRAFGVCPTDAEVEADVEILARHTNRVRIYSTECRNVNEILLKHSAQGRFSILFGVYVDNRPTDQQEVDYLIEALMAQPHGRIEGVVVGNEVLYRNTMSKHALISRIHEVRNKVRGAAAQTGNESYRTSPIYAVEIFPDPEIGGASDALGLNIHPFYRPDLVDVADPDVMSDRILKAAKEQIDLYRSMMPHKPIVVTEIGWPTHSDPSELHRGDPVIALKFMEKFTEFSRQSGFETYWFEAFDSPWKVPMYPTNQMSMSEFNFGLYKSDRVTIKSLQEVCPHCAYPQPPPHQTHYQPAPAAPSQAYAHHQEEVYGEDGSYAGAGARAQASPDGYASAETHVHVDGSSGGSAFAGSRAHHDQHSFQPSRAFAHSTAVVNTQPYRRLLMA